MFISVVFPAPFSPSKPWISPSANEKLMLSLANTPGNRLVIPSSSRIGAMRASSLDCAEDCLPSGPQGRPERGYYSIHCRCRQFGLAGKADVDPAGMHARVQKQE